MVVKYIIVVVRFLNVFKFLIIIIDSFDLFIAFKFLIIITDSFVLLVISIKTLLVILVDIIIIIIINFKPLDLICKNV